jgi:hypothetical protein
MKPPACDPGDVCIAQRAESTLFIPEVAKSTSTPKRFQPVSPFPFFEVGFIGWIVRVGFAFNLDVPFDGSALGVVQPDFMARQVLRTAFYFIPSAMTGFIVSVFPFRNRVSSKEAFEGLELGEGKPSRPVLRGPGSRKAVWLLGSNPKVRVADKPGTDGAGQHLGCFRD